MFDTWMLDHHQMQTRRAKPGGNITFLTAGDLLSVQIVTYEDGRTGILKTECLGQRPFSLLDP